MRSSATIHPHGERVYRGRWVPSLMRRAGFIAVEEIDVSERFRSTARAWLERSEEMAEELLPLEGRDVFLEQRQDRRETLVALEEGLLRRSIFVGQRPSSG